MWLIQCTNDAANGACCEVVAAEELDLLLGFRERSHDFWIVVLFVVGYRDVNGVCVLVEGRVARQQTTEVRRSTATKSKQCPRSGI
jgi:hypothetical protein